MVGEQVLVLSADPYDMVDEKTGGRIAGVSLWYVNKYREGDNGLKPTKSGCSLELYEKMKGQLPAMGQLVYGSKPGAGGKPTLVVVGVNITHKVDLFRQLSKPVAA